MHFTEYWAILERDHAIQNPSTPEKLRALADYCGLRDGTRALDVGSGKGWLLRDWARRWEIDGIGLEINPFFVAEARAQASRADLRGRLAFVEGPALSYSPEPASFDVITCIGATFALGSFDDAVAWMLRALKPGGVLALGDVFQVEPHAPVVGAPAHGTALHDLAGLAALLEQRGLTPTGLIAASHDDWDHYLSQTWQAARAWAAANPDHPDRAELLRQVDASRERYLRWERQHLGWAILVARHTP